VETKAQTDAIKAHIESIFRSGLDRVDPAAMVRSCLRVEGGERGETLVLRTELEEASYALSGYDRILVTGMGKAGARMALGVEEVLGARIAGGVVAVKAGHIEALGRIRLAEASHPVPDESSTRAAAQVLELARGIDERCLVIVLISGGGSSILCAPAPGISLEDKAETTRLLLASGATIQEVNCVRKHLSAVKGGRLAAAFAPATILALVLSDVIGDDLDAIASGPTVPDPTTWKDAWSVIERYRLSGRLPTRVEGLLRGGAEKRPGAAPDTPKPGDAAFARSRTILLGTNRLALMAAETRARELGYRTLLLTSRLTGEAREAAHLFLGIGKDIAASGFPLARPACVIAGGETTVTLRGKGKGGRNQEMALSFLAALRKAPKDGEGLMFLAASTDGSDGPTDAAGAFAHAAMLDLAAAKGLEAEDYLARNDSYAFFDRIGGLLRTGPTNTNVCDIQVLLVP